MKTTRALLRSGVRHPAELEGDNWQLQGMSSIRPTAAPCASGGQPAGEPGLSRPPALSALDGQRIGWEEALDTLAERFAAILAESGPDAIGIYLSGQLTTGGLLRRQQADEGVPGQRQRGHPTPGSACRRRWWPTSAPSGRIWCPPVTRIWSSRIWWCSPVPTPPGPIPCCFAACSRPGAAPELRLVVLDPRRTMTAEQGICTWRSNPAAT